MPEIQLKNVVKSYDGDTEVLKSLNLTLQADEFTVLVGPSGCGKSTLLRLLAGLEEVTSGQIFVDGKDITHLPSKDRNMAMVFQNYALYPHMSVADNITFSLKVAKLPKAEIEARLDWVARMLDIDMYLDRKPKDLSGGQRQRVAIGRALVRQTGIFLLDEPLSNLDANLRAQTRVELAVLHKKLNKNMVYVTHDQVEAMTLGDKIVVLSDGEIQQYGTPEDIFDRPVNKFVAGFNGSPPMNFLEAEVCRKDGHYFALGQGFEIRLPEKHHKALKDRLGRKIFVGIRPDDIILETEDTAKSADNVVTLQVMVSEYIGHHRNLIARCGAQQINVTVSSRHAVNLEESYDFSFKENKIHLFDFETELAL